MQKSFPPNQYCPPASKRPLAAPCSANCSIWDDSDCACKRKQAFSAVLLSPTSIKQTLYRKRLIDPVQARAAQKANCRALTLETNCLQGASQACCVEPTLLCSLVATRNSSHNTSSILYNDRARLQPRCRQTWALDLVLAYDSDSPKFIRLTLQT
jgi:hypothetical protein